MMPELRTELLKPATVHRELLDMADGLRERTVGAAVMKCNGNEVGLDEIELGDSAYSPPDAELLIVARYRDADFELRRRNLVGVTFDFIAEEARFQVRAMAAPTVYENPYFVDALAEIKVIAARPAAICVRAYAANRLSNPGLYGQIAA